MADAKKAAPKAAAKDKAPAKPKTEAKAAAKKPAAAAEAAPGTPCSVEKCKQTARAKGYCRKHYISWRRGDVGTHHRYKICSKEGCRKPRQTAGFCAEHAARKTVEEAPAAAPPAAAPPA